MAPKEGYGNGVMLPAVCSKCGGKTFTLKSDSGYSKLKELDNFIGWYYGIDITCKKCGKTHHLGMGSG